MFPKFFLEAHEHLFSLVMGMGAGKETKTQMILSWDELFQVLLFLPVSDVSRFSRTNSTAYTCIISNQHLWSVLLQRDFARLIEQLNGSLLIADRIKDEMRWCCDEMKKYVCYYERFSRFPFDQVEEKSMYDDVNNCTISKVFFGVSCSPLNRLVIHCLKSRTLEMPQNGNYPQIGMDFVHVWMKSRQPNVTPNFTLQLWVHSGQEKFPTISMCYYRGAQCMVITVDTKDAWNSEDYTIDHPYSDRGSNSLSRALAALREGQQRLNIAPPNACKSVSIVSVGVWSEDAPISKQRFLNDCAQVFDSLPLEYFELTKDNASVMSDIILKHFYTIHQQAALEDAKMVFNDQPKSGCILS